MRIAISGTGSIGKTTLIKDFLQQWSNYQTPEKTYRDFLGDKHSSNGCEETQWNILNFMVEELQKYDKDSNVIFDRCPLDNLVYTLWLFEKGKVSKAFVDKCIPIIRESMRFLDIIFFIPITAAAKVVIEDDGKRDADPVFISEIDNLFKAMQDQYQKAADADVFFPKDDSPGIIEIFGNRAERIALIQQYLDSEGKLIEPDTSFLTGEAAELYQQTMQ